MVADTDPSQQSAGGSGSSHKELKVLVVEDFRTMRQAIVDVLISLDAEVLEAETGLQALAVLDREKVDVVFTDIVMPEMDGFELVEEIRRRANLKDIPIIVISTHRDAKYVIQALRTGADDYLTKPFGAPLAAKVMERVMSNV